MNYNKNLIDLLDEASQIQKQLIINKDANAKIIAIRANDPDVSVCYTLSAPEDYLNFTGTKLAFYDFTKFVKCFRVFDIKSKDEKLSDTPVLDGVVNANNETTDIIIKSSKTKQKISYRAARADVLTQPVFNQIKMPAVDCKFTITQEELRTLYNERLIREKQTYISKMTGINSSVLSKFKTGKIDLYPHLFAKLEQYLNKKS